MLAMPVVTGVAGFLPAIVTFIFCWAFMTTTALLLLEVNIWLGPQVSIVSMAGRTLGWAGKALSWILFCYLFYLIIVAYTSASGTLFADFMEDYTGLRPANWIGSVLFSAIFALLVYLGTTAVDYVNRVLMFGLIVSYLLLIGFGIPEIQTKLLTFHDWGYTLIAAPVVVIAFGFHNMIPTITRYLHGNPKDLRLTVIIGSIIPLLIYLIWEWIILGIVPHEQFLGGETIATQALRTAAGSRWVSLSAQYFSFFAIVTSFVAQGLSLFHFLADGFHAWNRRILLCLLVFVPPLIAALIKPGIFIEALELAGAFGALVLFGILPALMAWVARYREVAVSKRLVPGGRPLLVFVILIASAIIVIQIVHQFR